MRLYEIENKKVLKTQNGSIIKRSSKYGVGKDMGGFLYLHAAYKDRLPDDFNHYEKALHTQFPKFDYNIIKYGKGGVTFLKSPDFDTAEEPTITEFVTVKPDGSAKAGTSKTIYHHKWLFVDDDYQGFDVEKSYQRSANWLKIPNIDFKRIGSSQEFWQDYLNKNAVHLPKDFFGESAYYTGQPLETGGTSTNFNSAAPGLQLLVKKGNIQQKDVVVDYGAGKYGRNANYLRDLGIKTYGYDPFNGYSDDGWEEVSTSLPDTTFDVGFTSFVLNVVPKHVEEHIITDVNRIAKHSYHIVRNNDVFIGVKNALSKRDKTVWAFFMKEFVPTLHNFDENNISDDLIREFCKFGVQTSRGFQRICHLEEYGYKLIKGNQTSPYKLYGK